MIIQSDKFLSDIQKRLTDLLVFTPDEKRQLYIAQGEVLLGSVLRQFIAQGGRYLSHKWAPLAKSTKKAYKRRGYSSKPTLDRTGRLKSATQLRVDSKGPEVTNNVEYAEYLQFGTRYMSPRPFLPMPPFQRNLLEEDIERIRNVTIKAFELKTQRLR